MAASRGANLQMETMCARIGWSHKELARRVNQRARVRGVHLRTDASRIRYWLAGQHPQPPVPELLSELFSEQLGYPITPTDIGLEATDEHDVGLRYSESITATVVAVAELGRYDVRRRGFLRQGTFLAVAAVAPSRDWLLAVLDATEPRPRSGIGEHQVHVIREAFATFHKADALRGGGHARRALAEFLTNRVLPLLHEVDPHSEVGAALFTAAGEQADLIGWMAIDDDRQALAQRYLIQALRLAQESGDIALGGHVLADMSHQARILGYPREALQLAITGRHGLARAYRASTFSDLDRAVEATRFARRSISAAASQSRARCGALSQATLARAALTRRDLDAALHAAHRAVDLSTTVQSSLCIAAIRDLQSRINPYRTIASARTFTDRAHEVLTQASRN